MEKADDMSSVFNEPNVTRREFLRFCGTCAAYGGLPAAAPNPTGAKGISEALPGLDVPVINIPGCPPDPINFVGTIASFLLEGRLPALDDFGRPVFGYGKKVHPQCPNRGDWQKCLKNEGCKGQWTYNNCPTIQFNDGANFPMGAGHPCIGCSEPDFWDRFNPFYAAPVNQKKSTRGCLAVHPKGVRRVHLRARRQFGQVRGGRLGAEDSDKRTGNSQPAHGEPVRP